MSSAMIDWDLAAAVGSRVAGEGPSVPGDEAVQIVDELRRDASRATGLVREYTGLMAPPDTAPVLVVDRSGWVRANAESFAVLLEPVAEKLVARKGPPSGLSGVVGPRVTGAEVGLVLGFLGSKVLGQFDPFSGPAGRLLLVAPNVVHVERELRVDPSDFRLWVCVHEETHRVQFTAVPWMRDHILSEIRALAETIDPGRLPEDFAARLGEALRGEGSLADVMGSPERKAIVDRITGFMSLLEGHADVVMDGVGPAVIPSVASIREKFNRRRRGGGPIDRLVRRLLGIEAKMAQYREGAAFVRGVVDRVGMDGLNAVWAAPEHLPTKAEIADPAVWTARVVG